MRSFVLTLVLAGVVMLEVPAWAQAGRAAGPMNRVRTVQGFHSYTIRIKFTGRQLAVVSVQGDGDSPLTAVVLDAQGRTVAGERRSGDRLTLRWTPASSGLFQVRISNHGGVPNRFRLTTN